MTYGKRLQEALTFAKKTRKQLADALGCTPQTIGIVIKWAGEKERKLSTEYHLDAARFLRVSAHWLATGEGEMEAVPYESGFTSLEQEINAIQQSDEPINKPEMVREAQRRWRESEAPQGRITKENGHYLIRKSSPPPKPENWPFALVTPQQYRDFLTDDDRQAIEQNVLSLMLVGSAKKQNAA